MKPRERGRERGREREREREREGGREKEREREGGREKPLIKHKKLGKLLPFSKTILVMG